MPSSASTSDDLYDVAIVGFGPSGAIAAALLGQYGLRVFVCDRLDTVYEKPRAISLDHEIMRVLQGLGLAEQVLPFTEPFTASEHFGAQGQLIRRLDMLAPPYPMGWIPSMVFLQPAVEKILRAHVADLPSVDVRLNARLIDLQQAADSVSLRFSEGSLVRARYVIGCDGASSTVRALSKLQLTDLDFDEPWMVIDVIANPQGLAKLPKQSAQYCEPARPASYIVGTKSHRRWEIMLLAGEDPELMQTDANVWKLLERWITPTEGELWRRASYRFHALVADQWRQGRVFIAGDAAHQQPPFLGQGMCQGVRDVANLSWKLEAVLRQRAGHSLLDSYGLERSAHVRALTTTIKGIGRYICERDPIAASVRDTQLLAEVAGIVKTVPRQDLLPALTEGLLSDQKNQAVGTLFPQPRVVHAGHSQLLDDVTQSGWHLVLSEEAFAWDLSAQTILQAAHTLPMLVLRIAASPGTKALQETEGVLTKWFAQHQALAAIVRPDHYVYAAIQEQAQLEPELVKLLACLST